MMELQAVITQRMFFTPNSYEYKDHTQLECLKKYGSQSFHFTFDFYTTKAFFMYH